MKRLFGLVLFSMGFGMTLVLIFPKNFLWVSIAISLMIVGYNMFCRLDSMLFQAEESL